MPTASLALSLLLLSLQLPGSVTTTADASVAAAMRKTQVPGVVVAMSSHGVVTFIKAYGFSDLAHRNRIRADSPFEIGSVTKQFTAAAVLQLADSGRLSLDDHLGKFVPQYVAGANVSIRNLLWQTSGIPNYTASPAFMKAAASKRSSLAGMLQLIAGEKLHFAPGTNWEYSNTNYFLLATIIEVASGTSYQSYLRSHIFKPAGMAHTAFISDEASLTGMPVGYLGSPLQPSPTLDGNWAQGCGDVVSTARDLLAWDEALIRGRIVSRKDVATLRSSGTLISGKRTNYGMGWYIDVLTGGTLDVWHNGGTLGFSADNETFPATGQAIVVLDNDINADAADIAKSIRRAMLP